MKLNTRLLAPFFIFSAFTNACSIPAISNDVNFKNTDITNLKTSNSNYSVNKQNPYIIDIGQKGGSSFNFKIKFSKSDFKIKANENGEVYTANDVDNIKVILFNQSSFTTGATISTDTIRGSFNISKSSNSSISTGNISVKFTNVPGNMNPYRVGIQALKGGQTITKAEGFYGVLESSSSEVYAVSDSGGDDNTGQLTIDPINLKFTGSGSPTTPLGSTLKLIDADGANVESQVTINNPNPDTIKLVRFYLVNDNSGVITVVPGSFNFTTGTKFGDLKAGTPTTIKFLNIRQGNYRVAAAAFDSTTASDTANITNGTDDLGLGLGNFALSSNMVTVNSNLVVSNPDPLALSLDLN